MGSSKQSSSPLSEFFESDTSERWRGLNETLESVPMRNIETLAVTPVEFFVDFKKLGEVGVNSICLWFVIPTLEWIISLVSSQNQNGWISNSSYVVPWVCKKSVWLAPLQVEGVDFYGVHNKTHRHHYPTTQYTHRAVKYTITYAPTHPHTLPFSVWQRSLLQSDRVTEVKRCDTVIVPSPTITIYHPLSQEKAAGELHTKLLQFHWKCFWTQQQITSVTSAMFPKLCVILHITGCDNGLCMKKNTA